MIKIVATIYNYGAAVNVGGDVDRHSVVFSVPAENIPARLKMHLENPDVAKYQTLSLSILDEE